MYQLEMIVFLALTYVCCRMTEEQIKKALREWRKQREDTTHAS